MKKNTGICLISKAGSYFKDPISACQKVFYHLL